MHIRPSVPSDTASYGHTSRAAYSLETGVTRAVAATRQLAKRQMTWLRAMPNIRVVDPYDAQSFVGVRESLNGAFCHPLSGVPAGGRVVCSRPSACLKNKENVMAKGQSLQDPFLNTLRKERIPVSIYLVNGIKLQGQIDSFDQFVVLLKNSVSQMVYKHAISTVVPARNVRITNEDGTTIEAVAGE